ncbi:MAG TPA: M36 family metallopeptidase, partial [Patescibacteria group bacterium]|nr:M36 family metallopeptidase [Patescibacteria group bacterium]
MPTHLHVSLKRSVLACLIASALSLPALAANESKGGGDEHRSYDARVTTQQTGERAPSARQAQAIAALRESVPELRFDIDPISGVTRTLTNMTGHLTGPNRGADNATVALNFVRDNAALLGLGAADLGEYEITDDVQSNASPVRHLYLRQKHQGVPVYNGQLQVHVDREGRILMVNNDFVPNLGASVNRLQPAITPEAAVSAAATQLNRAVGPITRISHDGGNLQRTVLNAAQLSRAPIDAKLMLLPTAEGVTRLVWNFPIQTIDGKDWAEFTVDAESGAVWTRHSYVAEAQYRVYPQPVESPQHTTPLPPADGRVLLVDPHAAGASPFGWHDTNGAAGAESTRTIGNNVHAYTDVDNTDTPDPGSDPDCGASLNCDFPLDLTQAPSSYRPAAVTNLFYFNNFLHDVTHPFGFDEASGNFQVNNYDNGGLGNDSVKAEAQDGEANNNANFGTPPDGQRPTMQMFIWDAPTPDRDGDLDNGIIAHEFGHGISNRLVGGPSNVSCLQNSQQAGEGLSDWWALYTTQPDATTRMRSIGTYALNQPVGGTGIRTDYYDGDPAVNAEPQENTWTYASINGAAIPHGVGSRWAQAYWQVTWALIDHHGYDADLDNYTGTNADKGNIRAMYYSIEGMKNSACSPTFTNIRDGIIAAATSANYTDKDTCRIWRAFAEFGLGSNAVSGGSGSTSPTNGFEIPVSCSFLGATTASQKICAGSPATFPITVGEAWVAPATATLALTGNPPPSSATFTPNPAPANSAASLTIGNTAGVTSGTYAMNVNGSNGTQTFDLPLSLSVFAAAPTASALSSPANAAVDVPVSPTLSWTAATNGDSYIVEVATDNAFSNIVYTQAVTTTSHAVATPLQGSTQYFWRVRTSNPCGTGGTSTVSSFTTQAFFCSTTDIVIPDNLPAGASGSLVVANGGTITDLDLSVVATHTWVGDLIFTLTHVESGTSVIAIDRPGRTGTSGNGCNRPNIDATLDDEAASPVESQCTTGTAINGTFTPNNPLAAFDGLDRAGTWRLTVSDNAGADTGTVTD